MLRLSLPSVPSLRFPLRACLPRRAALLFWMFLAIAGAMSLSTNSHAQSLRALHAFQGPPNGIDPQSALIQGQDGFLYGTTYSGGTNNLGTIFRMNPDGSGYVTLHTFTGSDGIHPHATLFQGTDTVLYGTTESGVNNYGTLFRLYPNGNGFQILHTFTSQANDGGQPNSALFQGKDGALYGTTYVGGMNGTGTLFKIKMDGSGFALLHSFNSTDGKFPDTMLQGKDGALYGTAYGGGDNAAGTLFKMNPDGTGFTVLHAFHTLDNNSGNPNSLIQGNDGMLYGTAESGGSSQVGTIFKVNPNVIGLNPIHSFNGSDGGTPCGIIQGTNGTLYGTTKLGTLYSMNTDGGFFFIYWNFGGGDDGSLPAAPLLQAKDGALYGTTRLGGSSQVGTIFKVNRDGNGFVTLHAFTGKGSDGVNPQAAVLQGKDGALYGTTFAGGDFNGGTLFKMNPDGTGFQVLHAFHLIGSDGGNPGAPLIQGSDGTLYGVAGIGGVNTGGTVFKVNPNGTGFVTLHTFNSSDGNYPNGVFLGKDGALYGSTQYGINHSSTLFKLNTDGSNFQVLHTFDGSTFHDAMPTVMQGTDGLLYGTTQQGGTNDQGTLFKMNADGTGFVTLYTFNGSDGYWPQAPLIQGLFGALYGTTFLGGDSGSGTLFRIKTDGTGFRTLHSFTGSSITGKDGGAPRAAVLQGANAVLYGTTWSGPDNHMGSLFRVSDGGGGFVTQHVFAGNDGNSPQAALMQSRDGALYGTTTQGGANNCGTLFRCFPRNRFDLNADTHLDLLWANTTTGSLGAWLMNGLTSIGTPVLSQGAGGGWQVSDTADLDGDGSPDLIWRNQQTGDLAVWHLWNNGALFDSVLLAPAVDLAWQVATVADLDGDGNPDLIWKNTRTGDLAVWYLNDTTLLGSAFLAHNVPLVWQMVGSADFAGNGHTGLLWRNTQTGDLGVWEMKNTQMVTSYTLALGVSLTYQVTAVGDLDGNGVPDILWRNTKTGDVTAWLFSDPTHFTGATIANSIPLAWQLVGPR